MTATQSPEGKFRSLFFTIGHPSDFSPAVWKSFFVPLDTARWQKDTAGGIVYETTDGTEHTLIIEYHPENGLTFAYERDNLLRDDFEEESWVSVGNEGSLSDFTLLDNGALHAVGSFLAPERAWEVVEKFLTDPTARPDAIRWIDADDLDWPDPP